MSEQASRESFLVRGENVGLWLPVTLALVGLIGALITAQMLLGDWTTKVVQQPKPMATEERQARGNTALVESGTAARKEIAAQVEASQAAPAPEVGLSAAVGTSQITEEGTASSASLEQPRHEVAGRELKPRGGAAASALGDQAALAQRSQAASISSQLVEPTPALSDVLHRGVPEGADHMQALRATPAQEMELSVVAVAPQITGKLATATVSQGRPRSEASGREIAPSDGSSSSISPLDDRATGEQSRKEIPTSARLVEPTVERESAATSAPVESGKVPPSAMTSEPESAQETAPVEAKAHRLPDRTQAVPASFIGSDTDAGQAIKERPIDCAPLFSVGFEHGSTKPEAGDMGERLTRLARWLNEHPKAILYVDGHADSSGPEETNLVISFRRAVAVSSLLADAGAPKARLVPRAYGESTASSPSAESEMRRRVTLEINSGIPCDQPVSKDGDPR